MRAIVHAVDALAWELRVASCERTEQLLIISENWTSTRGAGCQGAFMSAFENADSRTLTIRSPAIPLVLGQPALQPVRLSGREGMNSLFEYELLLKTPDALDVAASSAAGFDLDAFIGREIVCMVELDGAGVFDPGGVGRGADHVGAGVREINALIASAAVWGEEGRHVQYRLTLRPWLHLATLSTDCKIFQNKNVVQILDELLGDYAYPVDKRLFETYPQREFQTQYNETDFEFFERLCQEWGLSYHFEHADDKHRLILSDAMGAYTMAPSSAYREIEYHAPGWKTDAEYISSFVPQNQLTSGQYSTRDYDYTRPRADLSAGRKDPRPTGQSDGEVYQWHAAHAGSHYAQPLAGLAEANDPRSEGHLLALLRMQALRTHGERAQARGNLRGVVAGCTFKLQKHPREQANTEHLILDTHFTIEDVSQDSQNKEAVRERKQQWLVHVDFVVHPVAQVLRPASTRAKPRSGGPQSALVVGPDGQSIWTDALGRIKVQFPWDRLGRRNQHSSCWIRVGSPWAGNQLGGIHVPRIGQEVIVDFFGGDPDLPICTGRVHNQLNQPPWTLPDQSALSGFRSRELTGGGGNSAAGRSNHLLMDDTAGHLQVQFKSDHQSSSLSLGSITRVEDNAGRKDQRGEGFELRTDGHGAMRAMAGMLISTEGRADAARHIKDLDETIARLTKGCSLHENLGGAAQEAEAQEDTDHGAVVKALKDQNNAIKGAGPVNAQAGRFPELDEPHLVLASAAGIETTSACSTHIHAAEHVALTSGGHTSMASDKSLLGSARDAVRFFAYASGMRWVAYKGDIVVKAIKNSIQILANLDITASADTISITARKTLTLNGAGSTITLDASGVVEATGGTHRVFAAVHSKVGPRNAPAPAFAGTSHLEEAADDPGVRTVVLRSHPDDGYPLAKEPYTLYRDGAEIAKGFTDSHGRIVIKDHKEGTAGYTVRLSNGNEIEVPVAVRLQQAEQRLAAQGFRAAQGDPRDRLRHFQHQRDDANPA
jgi:type VI secretion system secreted protein VgrG